MDCPAPLQLLRQRRIELLTGGPELDAGIDTVQAAIAGLDRRCAEYLEAFASPATFGLVAPVEAAGALLEKLRELAVAWATPASAHFGKQELLEVVLAGLRHWATHYRPDSVPRGNWWFWEIGFPHAVTDMGLLLGTDLPADLHVAIDGFVRTFVPDPNFRTRMENFAETGANRADKAAIAIKHGALMDDAGRVAQGRAAVTDDAGGGELSLFAYVESGDGLYRDGSYIQHDKLAYAGAYGLVTLAEAADLIFILEGTPWAISVEDARAVFDSVTDCYSPFISDGRMMDCTRGRGVSRSFATDEHMGAVAAGAIARLATMDSPYAAKHKSLVKGWLSRHPGMPVAQLPLNRMSLLHDIANDPGVQPAPALQSHIQTPDQDRVVHRAGEWSAAVSLSSSRRGRFEWGNGENLHGWYQGDGQLQLFTAGDPGAYSGNYWATSDPLHLPGVTNVLGRGGARDAPGTGIPGATADWAGGVGWRNTHGTAGMLHERDDDALTANKSWFFLPQAVVCLGAGITGTGGQPVHTTVEARKVSGATFTFSAPDGGVPAWAHLAGVAGYLLLDAEPIDASRMIRTSSWRDINVGGSPEPVSDEYQHVVIDHGVDPVGKSYAYALYPGVELARMPATAAAPGFHVLANTADVQAIEVLDAGIVMANFFAAGTAGELAADGSAAVVVGPGEHEGTLQLAVSDPAQRNVPLKVTVQRPGLELVDAPAGTVVVAGADSISITLLTPGSRGHALLVTLRCRDNRLD